MLVVDVGVPEEVGIGLGGALSWGRLGIGSGGGGGFGKDGALGLGLGVRRVRVRVRVKVRGRVRVRTLTLTLTLTLTHLDAELAYRPVGLLHVALHVHDEVPWEGLEAHLVRVGVGVG